MIGLETSGATGIGFASGNTSVSQHTQNYTNFSSQNSSPNYANFNFSSQNTPAASYGMQTPNYTNFSSQNTPSTIPSYMMGLETSGATGIGIANTPHTNAPQNQNFMHNNSFHAPQNMSTLPNMNTNLPTPMNSLAPSFNPEMNSPACEMGISGSSNLGYGNPVGNVPMMGPLNTMATMPMHAMTAPQLPYSMPNPGYPIMNQYAHSVLPVPQALALRHSSGAHNISSGGKRRALIIGINYIHCKRGKLNGCINDAHNMARFMSYHFGFRDIRLMTDDQPLNSPNYPTRANLVSGMRWLVSGAQPGDSFFYHYSGHGGQAEDKTHLEDDGLNETILPVDWDTKGMIIDDDLHDMLCRPLPEGSRLTAIFDSCHSGTALDLPYIYKVQYGEYKGAHKAEEDRFWGRHKAKLEEQKGKKGPITAIASHVTGEIGHQVKKRVRNGIMKRLNTTKAIVVMFSGCRDDQTSADTTQANQATGAMSYAFISTLTEHQNVISYADLLEGMRRTLHNGPKQYDQVPQLSYGRPMDMSQAFVM